MAISLVNFSGGSQQGGPFSTVVSAGQSVANGNTLVAGFRWSANTVTDNAGNTWQPLPHLPGVPISNLGEGLQFFWVPGGCVGNLNLIVTANLVSTSQALDTYTAMGVWNISGGPLVLDQYLMFTANSGTTMTYGPFATRYQNTIACLIGMSTANLNTETVTAPLIQDGGTSIAGQQVAGAGHAIFTSMLSSQSLVMTTSVNGTWQMGGPVFGSPNPQTPPVRRRRAAIASAPPMFTGRMYDYFITLERIWPLS